MKVMRLSASGFIRRLSIHVLPSGFHRIRHGGFPANGVRRVRIRGIRAPFGAVKQHPRGGDDDQLPEAAGRHMRRPCPECGGVMAVIGTFGRGETPESRAPPRETAAGQQADTCSQPLDAPAASAVLRPDPGKQRPILRLHLEERAKNRCRVAETEDPNAPGTASRCLSLPAQRTIPIPPETARAFRRAGLSPPNDAHPAATNLQ